MFQEDYIIVGSGLTGATLARVLKENSKRVMIFERRSHLGGNVHDHVHPSGIRIHTYGPHYFRTSSERIWKFVNRFGEFYPYEACLKSFVDGQCENWPVAASYIRRVLGETWGPEFRGTPSNFEEASLAMMPRVVYEKFVKGYTEKQWGVPASSLSAELAGRFDVREDDDPRLVRHKYQGIPSDGYAALMQRMLEGIPVVLNFDYLKNKDLIKAKKLLIFTGPIDEFFGFDMGKLAYRGQQREHRYFPDVDVFQPCGQVNNPVLTDGKYIRTLEWKHMMRPEHALRIKGTVITHEIPMTPENPDNYEYPFPDEINRQLYKAYRNRAAAIPNLLICGRLGEYKYYDMDQAIARAIKLAEEILRNDRKQ